MDHALARRLTKRKIMPLKQRVASHTRHKRVVGAPQRFKGDNAGARKHATHPPCKRAVIGTYVEDSLYVAWAHHVVPKGIVVHIHLQRLAYELDRFRAGMPVIVGLLAQQMLGEPHAIDPHPFRPQRFLRA